MRRRRGRARPGQINRRKVIRAKKVTNRAQRSLRVRKAMKPVRRVRQARKTTSARRVIPVNTGSGPVRKKLIQKPSILRKLIIAITGSAGKTTTKEMIASILQRRWLIYKSPANKNFMGNTLTHARSLRPQHRAAVLEYGIMYSGNLRKHCSILQPNIGVITNIGTAHLGNFGGSIARLALAKSELIRYMKPTGLVFLNADCPYSRRFHLQPYRGRFAGKFITVGVNNPATYRGYNVRYEKAGMRFECKLNGIAYSFFIPVHGSHNITNALLAIAVAHTLGFSPAIIQAGLRTYSRPYRRLMTYEQNGIRVIDDTYSANPTAMQAAINVLAETGKGTNVAVLGSMLELGRYTVGGHMDVGRYLARKKVDYLYTFGPYAKYIATGAIRAGFPKLRVLHCQNRAQLHSQLAKLMKPNTTFLVKGSNKVRMDVTAGFLRALAAKQPRMVNNEGQTPVEVVWQFLSGGTSAETTLESNAAETPIIEPQDQTDVNGTEQQD